MLRRACLLVSISLPLIVTACASDPVAIGGACSNAGKADECVDGAICSNASSGATCRKICSEQAQCAATESCSGISGTTTKSCQPK
jgi:hypothetical protein